MSKIIFKAKSMRFQNGCLLLPATPGDRKILDSFCEEATNHIITVTANYSRSKKTYDQVKTVFALTSILFECNYDRTPSSSENELMYRSLLEEYAPKTESMLNPDIKVPIPLSQMSVSEAAEFIQALIDLIMENCDLTDKQQVDVKQIFEEFHANCGYGKNNPIDYDKNGNLLSEEEWRRKNDYSFASGIKGSDDIVLHLHHIISRGARKDLIDNPTNWIMLTAEEHMFYHEKGWAEFLAVYPSCAERIRNDFIINHHPMPFDLQKALIKLGLLDSLQEDAIPEEEGLF